MAQRCSFCGRTKKQHNGRACVDVEGFKKILKQRADSYATLTGNGVGEVDATADAGVVGVLGNGEVDRVGHKGDF